MRLMHNWKIFLGMSLLFMLACNGIGTPSFQDIELYDLEGNIVDLNSSVFKDKVLVINFWETWCPPCRKEIPGIIKASNKLKKNEIIFFLVSDEKETTLTRFFEKEKIGAASVLRSPSNLKLEGVFTIPQAFVVKNGKVLAHHIDFVDWGLKENQKELLSF